jgi:chemotaxis regulatin CheY-phosphate phosphatase CheZ
MTSRHADKLFYDSEATLRLVDSALDDLRMPLAAMQPADTRHPDMNLQLGPLTIGLAELPQVLLRAYSEISGVLTTLRQSRDVLEQTTVEKLHQTNNKLREVTSATETAATDMLDGLDRSLALVDELDAEAAAGTSQRAPELHAELRNELFGLMNCLQFQDITTQQLNYASSVLIDMENRLTELVHLFDPQKLGIDTSSLQLRPQSLAAFDPAATTSDAEHRQALVDEIFARP